MNKNINIASNTDVLPLIGLGNRPSVAEATLFIDMKMIEDLGWAYPTQHSSYKAHYAIYECPYCGKQFRCTTQNVKSGATQSCGCMKYKWISEGKSKHRYCGTRIYGVWKNMKQRCYNPNNKAYKFYGARGIEICKEWENDFMAFCEWSMNSGYSDVLTIDRINEKLGYSANNCQWISFDENRRKRGMYQNNTSGYKGVSLHYNKWVSRIIVCGRRIWIGAYPNAISAAIAYNNYIIEHKLNIKLNVI